MHGAKAQAAIDVFNIRCSTDARAMLEQMLQPTAVVGFGEGEFGLRYRLTAPVVNADGLKKLKQARECAARLTGSRANGRINRKNCRLSAMTPTPRSTSRMCVGSCGTR